ncbi:MAG: COG1470 family protein [Anaerolineae bacterium]
MQHVRVLTALVTALALFIGMALPALAQTPTPEAPVFTLSTNYPSQTIGLAEEVTLSLKLRSTYPAQIVRLELREVAEGWTATFRGGGRIVQSVFVDATATASVDLRLEPPKGVQPGTYRFLVVARGEGVQAELPIELTVREKVPAKLSMETNDLLTIKGAPTTTFRWNLTLKNDGDEDLSVNLSADLPAGFQVTFRYSGQEVSNLPVEANRSKSVSAEVKAFIEPKAGRYPINFRAEAGNLSASLSVNAEVTGQPTLSITTADGRLSGRATIGQETALKLVVKNTGTAAARAVEFSSSEPSGWTVTFDPKKVDEVPAGQQVEVTAKLRPADKALAGDYIVTLRARPDGGSNVSADFRITVTTSTLWGVAGVALIAAAVLAVGVVVARFGRR